MKQQKKGISLIVLVITIIVMLILASAVIISLSNSDIITKAKEAVIKTDVKNFAQELSISFTQEKLENKDLDTNSVTATDVEEIKKYIPNFDAKYAGKIFIQDGELVYDASKVTESEKTALESIGVKSGTIYTPAEIKAIIESKNLGTDVSTTDITTYIEGISKKEATKYTIFRGDLYYRYEKTTYEEQLELYNAGISILMGDANEDGTLTIEDSQRVEESECYGDYGENEINLIYVCNLDQSDEITTNDGYLIDVIIAGQRTILDLVSIEEQHPDEIIFVGDYIWFTRSYGCTSLPKGLNTTEASVIKEYYPTMTDAQIKKFKITDGELVYNAEVLTEMEKAWADEYRLLYE